jgi:large subunit ribosomal protein L13
MRVIDGTNMILGRFCSYIAKELLEKEDEIVIVNAEKVIVTGRKGFTIAHYKEERYVGSVRKGPRFPKEPDRILRRTVRGMLPMKTTRGRDALDRLHTFIDVPKEYRNSEPEKHDEFKNKHVSNVFTLLEVSRELGSKVKVDGN